MLGLVATLGLSLAVGSGHYSGCFAWASVGLPLLLTTGSIAWASGAVAHSLVAPRDVGSS